MLDIAVVCPLCGKKSIVTVSETEYEAWQAGALAQDVFPYLTANEREMLISGICPMCWDEMSEGDDPEDSGEDEDPDGEYDDEMLECGFDPYEGCYTFDC